MYIKINNIRKSITIIIFAETPLDNRILFIIKVKNIQNVSLSHFPYNGYAIKSSIDSSLYKHIVNRTLDGEQILLRPDNSSWVWR